MNRIPIHAVTILLVVLGHLGASAAAADPAATIAPFVDEHTFAVVRVDVSRINVDALFAKFIEVVLQGVDNDADRIYIETTSRRADSGRNQAASWFATFTEARGSEVYLLLHIEALAEQPFIAVIPLEQGADANAIATLLRPLFGPDDHTAKVGTALVIAPQFLLDRLTNPDRVAEISRLALLKKAFAAAGDGPIQVLLIPVDYARRALEELVPALPPELGGEPVTALTRGLQWAALGIDLPPKMSLHLTIQSQDVASAKALRNVIDHTVAYITRKFLETLGVRISFNRATTQPAAQQIELGPEEKALTAFIVKLVPSINGNRLLLTFDAQSMDAMLEAVAPLFIQKARRDAVHTRSLSQLHQMIVACYTYPQEKRHKGKFPPDLGTLHQEGFLAAELLLSQASDTKLPPDFDQWTKMKRSGWLNQNTSYVYIPDLNGQPNLTKIALIEKPQVTIGGRIAVAFRNDAVHLPDLDEARQLIKEQTGFTLEQWSQVASGQTPAAVEGGRQ